ncbi:F-box/LRR-repeat protein At3g03360-like [Lycium barbarum]|uniref:F-box/LRR-repeat protein At3g03360-like n=1 Tax=Lycium barbarum TaxID=112863 RepID=UPI00293EC128|nr:F-box/LRR-repeat protein At3g03360-like [Lycium barbarum]XP_060179751.1 F-box/LRR-repeat protein At3g03360-like [Lycium barbarum]
MVGVDRLSDLPEPILIHILSMLGEGKEVVRSGVLSTRWRFLWMSVPVSLYYHLPVDQGENEVHDFVTSINRELHYWRSCQKIRRFSVFFDIREEKFVSDVDLWVYFATKLANVEDFTLGLFFMNDQIYEFPQFAYKNTSLRNLFLWFCQLNPSGSVNWSSLVSLSIMYPKNTTEGVMEKVLAGCPNLECLRLHYLRGIHHLEISNVKLRELIIMDYKTDESDIWLEIVAPYIQNLQLMGSCSEIRLRNVASLVSAVLSLDFDFGDGDEWQKESSCLKQLLHSVARVENLKLGPWCIECLSILELKGWQLPPSSRKSLQLNRSFEQLDLPGICRFLQSSSNIETLVIDGFSHDTRDLLSKYTNEDEQRRRFETHNYNCSLLHLKTIKFINFLGPLRKNKAVLSSVKYLLKHATVLEKFVIAGRYKGAAASLDFVKMELEFPRFPRSSPHASFIFSYC